MLPAFSPNNIRHLRLGNTKLTGKVALSHASGIKLTYLARLRFCYFCTTGIFANFYLSVRPVLFDSIYHIVLMRSQKKMKRVAAWWVIADVQYMHPIGDWPIMDLIRNAVSRQRSIFASDAPVIARASAASPFPALIRAALVNLSPESFIQSLALMVVVYKSQRFTLYPSMLAVVLSSNLSSLSTPAMAVTIRDFVCWFARGMIVHAKFSFQNLATPRAISSSAVVLYWRRSLL